MPSKAVNYFNYSSFMGNMVCLARDKIRFSNKHSMDFEHNFAIKVEDCSHGPQTEAHESLNNEQLFEDIFIHHRHHFTNFWFGNGVIRA